jgi:putative heme-binding domain-containing protein
MQLFLTILLTLLVAATATAMARAQGHGYTPLDIENGGQLYQGNCTACHGPDGDGVPGTNLGAGTFRRGTADEDIARIIVGGIPGTAMPPSSFSDGQALTIVAYLRSLATAPRGTAIPGDPARGRSIVEGKGQCLGCHAIGGVGSRTGPSLTDIGTVRRATDLQRSLLDPSAQVRSDNQTVRVVTRQGEAIAGRLLNQDSFSVQLIDAKERLRLLERSALREVVIRKESSMPAYEDRLTPQEQADVVSFLTTLRGRR